MKKLIFIYTMIFGMAAFAISCAEPEEPTPANQLFGSWTVVDLFVNGQQNDGGTLDRFFLERDNTFLLEDDNDVLFVGTWTATADRLTLTAEDGTVFDFEIELLSFTRLQVEQTVNNPTTGNLSIRYLMNKDSRSTF